MHGAPAPHRIRKEIMLAPVEHGGFGLVDLESVMIASRIKRYSYLIENNTHPIAGLQRALCRNDSINVEPHINIDDVSTSVLLKLQKHYLQALHSASDVCFETDVNLQTILANSHIKNICIKNKLRGREIAILTRDGICTVKQAINIGGNSIVMMLSTMNTVIRRHIQTLINIYEGTQLPQHNPSVHLFDPHRMNMFAIAQLPSRNIRNMLNPTKALNNTKFLTTTAEESVNIYNKIKKIGSIQNRTKILRLIHGDVYCGARLKKFKLSDNDRCHRCFAEETINHLLLDCPYTKEVWHTLGLNPTSLNDILSDATMVEIEILSQFLNEIIFRRRILPTEVLVKLTYTAFANGLSKNRKVMEKAKLIVNSHQLTGSWHIT